MVKSKDWRCDCTGCSNSGSAKHSSGKKWKKVPTTFLLPRERWTGHCCASCQTRSIKKGKGFDDPSNVPASVINNRHTRASAAVTTENSIEAPSRAHGNTELALLADGKGSSPFARRKRGGQKRRVSYEDEVVAITSEYPDECVSQEIKLSHCSPPNLTL